MMFPNLFIKIIKNELKMWLNALVNDVEKITAITSDKPNDNWETQHFAKLLIWKLPKHSCCKRSSFINVEPDSIDRFDDGRQTNDATKIKCEEFMMCACLRIFSVE